MAKLFNLGTNSQGEMFGPRRRQVGRLFDYLGIQDPADKRAFRMGARGGTLRQYFADRPSSLDLFSKLVQDPASGGYTGRKAKRYDRMQGAAQQLGYVGQYNKPGTPLTTPIDSKPPMTPGPPGVAPGSGAPPTVPMSIEDMMKKLGGYMGPTGQGISSQITGLLNGQGNLAPGFQNMFENLMAVHNREGDRNIAALNEAMGSRGARYGSDILDAQGDMRRQQTQDLALAGNQLALQLGQQQQGLIGQSLQASQLEQQARENAMSRMFQEYLMQSQLPPIFQSMIGALSGLPQNDTLSYIS